MKYLIWSEIQKRLDNFLTSNTDTKISVIYIIPMLVLYKRHTEISILRQIDH